MWDAASTCQIVSIKSSAASSLGQAFGNITWNSPSQGNDVDFPSGLSAGGNFTVVTNPKYIRLNKTSSLRTVTVGGNMTIQGGLVVVAGDAGATTIVVDGSFSQSGGTFDLGEGNGAGLLQVKGNFSHSGGTLQRKNSSGTGTIEFGGSGIQDLIAGGNYPSGVESRVHFTVNTGSTLYLGANLLGGGGSGTSSGNFTLQSGATLGIGHSGGVTVSGASGNVRVTGTRNYSTAANYVYNGTSAQSAGNGLPTTVNNLTFNNPSSVTLGSNVVVANILSLMGGNITTGTNTLTLGTSTSSLGTLTRTSGTIVGNFRRWFAGVTASDVLFPVGTATYYRPADISFTVVPSTGGTLVSSFGASNPGFSGLPLVDSGVSIVDVGVDGYWTLVAGNGLSGGVYSLDLTVHTHPERGQV